MTANIRLETGSIHAGVRQTRIHVIDKELYFSGMTEGVAHIR